MVNTVLNKFLLIAGFVSLAHAAYSAAHYRTYLRLTEQEFTKLPLDIVVQIVASLILLVYNLIQIVGNFKEIRATVDMQAKSWDTLEERPYRRITTNYTDTKLNVNKCILWNYIPEEETEGKWELDLNS